MFVRLRHAFVLTILLSTMLASSRVARAASEDDVRLVVVVVVDQLRADLVTRYAKHFGDDGFRRLMREGAHFTNAYYSYGSAATAPGHATLSTGRIPRQHGIVGNQWVAYEGGTPRTQYAQSDAATRLVGADGPIDFPGASPVALIGPTLGDQLKLTDAGSRVFAVALKDRAAVFMGGHRPDGVFWWNKTTGEAITSTYYADALPSYLAEFNRSRWIDRFSGETWQAVLGAEAYSTQRSISELCWADRSSLGLGFPHGVGTTNDGRSFLGALMASPFGNDITLEMARRILLEEKLGTGDRVDLLWISLSSNDVCGHLYGPESPEVLDMTVQTDRQIARLLALLDGQIGLDKCIVALTGDHGTTAAPCVTEAMGLGGDYLDGDSVLAGLNEHLSAASGKLPEGYDYAVALHLPWLYLNERVIQSEGSAEPIPRGEIRRKAVEYLRTIDGIADVFTAGELNGHAPSADDVDRLLAWRCYQPGRSGDLYVKLSPHWYKRDANTSGHNAGFNQDRHVPIMIRGPRVVPGRYFVAANPCDLPVTIAALLGIEPPVDAVGRVLFEALDTRVP